MKRASVLLTLLGATLAFGGQVALEKDLILLL